MAEQFDRVFDGALSREQFSAAGSAAALKARLLGFMREKIEIGGPGEFDGCKTVDDVIDELLTQQSPADALEMLDQLREMIEQRAANQATIIEQPTTARQPPDDELARSLALFQKHRR